MTEAATATAGPRERQTDAVRLDGVRRAFPAPRGRPSRAPVVALDGVSLRAAPGEVLAVVGPSGSGKTTLLELVCGLQRPDAGTVRAAPAVLMPQRDLLLPWLSALDNAALPLRLGAGGSARRGRPTDRAGRTATRERARPLFARFGLAGFEGARPHELSGGMRQRVAFLRTLLAGKPVLCLDEPFGALDALTRREMQDWLQDALAARAPELGAQRTVLLVTHDVEEAAVLSDRVVVLTPRPGRVAATLEVDLPRPRRATDPGVVALRERALEALRT